MEYTLASFYIFKEILSIDIQDFDLLISSSDKYFIVIKDLKSCLFLLLHSHFLVNHLVSGFC